MQYKIYVQQKNGACYMYQAASTNRQQTQQTDNPVNRDCALFSCH